MPMSEANEKVAVLCPGESLDLYPGPEGYQCVIGVNRVALWHDLQYLVCRDLHTFEWLVGEGGPRELLYLVTEPAIMAEIWQRWHWAKRYIHKNSRLIQAPMLQKIAWRRFGSLTALALAAELLDGLPGPGRIDCFGMDMAGQADRDGFTDGRQWRDEARWIKERRLFGECVLALKAAGIEVKRHVRDEVTA